MKTDLVNSGFVRPAALSAVVLAIAGCAAHHNPNDPVSNPDKLKYSDVNMTIPEYDVPFKRDGAVENPALFRQIVPGMQAQAVAGKLGQPLSRTNGQDGPEWNYNFTLRMPASQNYLVCQYKVVFDDSQRQVKETVWRRRQCLDIVNGAA
ncbi:outer membrane protein assembly factor BamE domain-containing protein [Candidimonas nitroreducens]|uniref:Outer membrane protein assembly factor BamE domain-containing protein n=1 Tax=Candidimonas nitroreducens TaxID=683354 RepID=A0A225M2H9_9BURK|nr:outer membrane protein assembly factor BamE [Candidimonas nitroreducens]OWT54433.1 hypothetical protein CEY11_22155 [Candidimonas nitroreducens]